MLAARERRPGALGDGARGRRRPPSDYELKRGGIANSGTVEAVAPLPGRRDQYVVVTRELTTATATRAYQGLRPAWHVALASARPSSPRAVGRQPLAAGELRTSVTRDVEDDRDGEAQQRQGPDQHPAL